MAGQPDEREEAVPRCGAQELAELLLGLLDPDAKPEDDLKENPFSVLAQLKGDKH